MPYKIRGRTMPGMQPGQRSGGKPCSHDGQRVTIREATPCG